MGILIYSISNMTLWISFILDEFMQNIIDAIHELNQFIDLHPMLYVYCNSLLYSVHAISPLLVLSHTILLMLFNPCLVEFILEMMKIYLYFVIFLNAVITNAVKIFLSWKTRIQIFILYSQYRGCWLPGDARIQDISSHDIDLVLREYSLFSTRRVNLPYCCYIIS